MTDSDADSKLPLLETAEQRLKTGVDRSRLIGTARTFARYARLSWLYRWFTAEPEPDVIVIDLRETYTIGPVIHLLDRILEHCSRAAASSTVVDLARRVEGRSRVCPLRILGAVMFATVVLSGTFSFVLGQTGTGWIVGHILIAGLAVLGLRSERTLEDLTETRPWELLAAAFEPPSQPDETDRSIDGAERPSDDERSSATDER